MIYRFGKLQFGAKTPEGLHSPLAMCFSPQTGKELLFTISNNLHGRTCSACATCNSKYVQETVPSSIGDLQECLPPTIHGRTGVSAELEIHLNIPFFAQDSVYQFFRYFLMSFMKLENLNFIIK